VAISVLDCSSSPPHVGQLIIQISKKKYDVIFCLVDFVAVS
jgi:hypothetical protein